MNKIKYRTVTLDELRKYRLSHKVRTPALVDEIVRSFIKNGWAGPPIVLREGTIRDALGSVDSGVHRVAALERVSIMLDAGGFDGDVALRNRVRRLLLSIPVLAPKYPHLCVSSTYKGRDWINRWIRPLICHERATLYATNALTLQVIGNGIPGVLVVCRSIVGGYHAAVMSYSCRFQSPKTHRDIVVVGTLAEDAVRDRLERLDARMSKVRIVNGGSIYEAIDAAPAAEIAFLHLSVDSYRATVHALEKFHPRMSDGGFVFVDNWENSRVADGIRSYFNGDVDADVVPGRSGVLLWQVGRSGAAFWLGEKETLHIASMEGLQEGEVE